MINPRRNIYIYNLIQIISMSHAECVLKNQTITTKPLNSYTCAIAVVYIILIKAQFSQYYFQPICGNIAII